MTVHPGQHKEILLLNFLTSVVRTGVPYLWGLVVAWLATRGGVFAELAGAVDPAWQDLVTGATLAVVTTAVYAVVRVIEQKLPAILGKVLPPDVVGTVVKLVLVLLIGVPKQPVYDRPAS